MNYRVTIYGTKVFKNERVNVLVDKPHVASLANLIKLKHFYSSIDERKKEIDAPYKVWLRFRNKWLRKQKKLHGFLTCFYCKEPNLNANINSPALNSHRKMATIDHVMPVSKGGRKFDEKNLVVCCWVCNQRKADKMPDNFNE